MWNESAVYVWCYDIQLIRYYLVSRKIGSFNVTCVVRTWSAVWSSPKTALSRELHDSTQFGTPAGRS